MNAYNNNKYPMSEIEQKAEGHMEKRKLNEEIEQVVPYHALDSILTRINADNSRPRHIFCFWLTFIYIIGVCIVLAVFVAPAQIIVKSNQTQLKNTADHKCMNPCGFQNNTLFCNPFGVHNPTLGLLLRNINRLHQFALIHLDMGLKNNTVDHSISQNITISLYSMRLVREGSTGRFVKADEIANRTIEFLDNDKNNTFSFYGEQIDHLVGFHRQLNEENYLLLVKFQNVNAISKSAIDPKLKAILINPKFSIFVILIRAIGFVATLITGGLYLRRYLKTQKTQRLLQQKMVFAMSILILLFNDPFYALTVLKPSAVGSIFSVLFLTQFIVYLLFFWIVGAERIYKQQGQIPSNVMRPIKKLVYFIYFASYFVLISWYYSGIAVASYEGHFIVNPQQISPKLSVIFFIWLMANFALYGTVTMMICIEDKAILWRSRSWLYFNSYFAIILLIFIIVTGSFYQQNSKLLLICYTSVNLYCIYMQYMFSASTTKQQEISRLIPISNNELQGQSTQIQMNQPNFNMKMINQNNSISSDL